MSGGRAPVKSRWQLAALGALFAGVAVALYAPSYGAPFVADDVLYLEHNPNFALPIGQALPRVLLQPYFANWSPLHHLLLYAEWSAFGMRALPYRVVNAILHACVSLAFVAAGRRAGLSRRAAVAAGTLFLVHPVAAEAVAWINQSKTLLAVGLCVVALERWLAHLRAPAPRRLAAATALGVLALLAKPAALPLPAILLAAAWTHGCGSAGRGMRRAAVELLPLALVAAVAFALNVHAQSTQGGVAPWFGGSPEATLRMLPWIAWRYVRIVAAPLDLSHGVHPVPTSGWADPRVWLPLAGLLAVAAGVAAACRARRERALGAAWFALMLLPVVQVIPMIEVFADRYLYAALPGALGLAADVGDAWARRNGLRATRAVAAAAALAAIGLAAITAQRAVLWGRPEALYRESADAWPLGRTGWTGLGAELHRKGDLDGAAAAYLRSLAVHPDDGHVRQLLGRVRLRQQQRELALYDLEESLRLAPAQPDSDWARRIVRQLRDRSVVPREDGRP